MQRKTRPPVGQNGWLYAGYAAVFALLGLPLGALLSLDDYLSPKPLVSGLAVSVLGATVGLALYQLAAHLDQPVTLAAALGAALVCWTLWRLLGGPPYHPSWLAYRRLATVGMAFALVADVVIAVLRSPDPESPS